MFLHGSQADFTAFFQIQNSLDDGPQERTFFGSLLEVLDRLDYRYTPPSVGDQQGTPCFGNLFEKTAGIDLQIGNGNDVL